MKFYEITLFIIKSINILLYLLINLIYQLIFINLIFYYNKSHFSIIKN